MDKKLILPGPDNQPGSEYIWVLSTYYLNIFNYGQIILNKLLFKRFL